MSMENNTLQRKGAEAVTLAKPKTVHGPDIDWQPAEWTDEDQQGLTAIIEGIELSVYRENKDWPWTVKLTSEVSETPEVVDAGTAKSQSGGQTACREALNRHRRSRYQEQRQAEEAAAEQRKRDMATGHPEPEKAMKQLEEMLVTHIEPAPVTDVPAKDKAEVENNLQKARSPKRVKQAA